jgi:hypothetical protein
VLATAKLFVNGSSQLLAVYEATTSMRYREITSYPEMVQREGIALQKGMNFRVRGGTAGYSIILMSVRKGAPYKDQWHEESEGSPHAGMLEYEGHDAPRIRDSGVDPKRVDQPMKLPGGKLTDNGKFFEAAMSAKAGTAAPEVVQVYEKIAAGIWCDRGRYVLVDAEFKAVPIAPGSSGTRNVFRFYLRPTKTPDVTTREDERELSISRQIPTAVKVAVWKRDQGRCVECGATDNLHFDHDVPFSKGGSSITEANVKLLCARHNLEKSDKIISLGPLLGPLVAATVASMVRGA